MVVTCTSSGFIFPPLMHLWQVGGRIFPLEAVKQLQGLMDLDVGISRHLSETSTVAVCGNPLLPQVFRPVCQRKGAGLVFSQLGKNAVCDVLIHKNQCGGVKKRKSVENQSQCLVSYTISVLLVCFLIHLDCFDKQKRNAIV